QEPLGTGGGVRNAADLVSGTVFVFNGDILTDADLTAMRQFHEARGSRTTIFLQPVPDPRQYGLVETERSGRLLRFREKPAADEEIATDTINAGIYLIDAALLGRIPSERPSSIEREFFPALIGEGSTVGPDARVESAILWERVAVGAGAVLHECVIGADVKIGAHARVGSGVVLESGAVIPERTTLAR